MTVAAFVFAFGPPMADSNVAWAQCEETAELLPADRALNDHAGFSVSISGDVLVVGAHRDDDNGSQSGSAYVFRKSGSTWIEEQKLTASDPASTDLFGYSVAVSGNTVVVGSKLDDDLGNSSGSAYIFRFDGSTWIEEQKLLASDGAAADVFGHSVAISGDGIIIGAHNADNSGFGPDGNGAAYVFRFDGANWVQEEKLVASDGQAADFFGYSVAVSGDVVTVGAHLNDDFGNFSGSAYIFRKSGSTWIEEQKLLPTDGAAFDKFGLSVGISGDVAVIGASLDDDSGDNSGSAYVFGFNGSSWVQEQKLLPSDGAAFDQFGFSVAIEGDTAVIGAWADDDDGTNSGSAYVFRFNGSSWVADQKLLASDGASYDSLGWSVGISGDETVAGAPGNSDNIWASGSAYIFANDGTVGAFELSIVLGAWGPNPGHPADFNGDGVVDPTDLAQVLGEWRPCP